MFARPRRTVRPLQIRSHAAIASGLVTVFVASATFLPLGHADDTRRKAALSLLEVAKFYYQSGKFLKAAKGFHEAYAIDPRPEFLFNAARAEHLGMDLDNAATHYRKCLDLKTRNAKLNKRARLYLTQVESTLAALAKARKEGAKAAAQKQREEAAKAAQVKSGSTEGRLEGVDKVAAKPDAAKAAPGAPVKGAVTKHDAGPPSSATPKKPEKPAPKQPPTAKPKGPLDSQPSLGWRAPVGWGALGVGAVAAGFGIVTMLDYASGQADLDAKLAKTDGDGKIVGIGAADYRQQQTDLNTQNATAVTGFVAGAVLLGGGAYLLLTRPGTDVAIAPWAGSRGMTVRMRF